MKLPWQYLACMLLAASAVIWTPLEAGEHPDIRRFDQSSWEDKVENADYFRDKKKQEEAEEESAMDMSERKGMREISLGPLKYVLLILVGVVIVFVLLRVFASELFGQPRKLDGSAEHQIYDLDKGLADAPLERMLSQYLENGDYRGAIRAYYLLVLQLLNARGWINWHREKTNNHYVREMRRHREAAAFRSLTATYERAWYGDQEAFEYRDFEEVEPAFRRLISAIDG